MRLAGGDVAIVRGPEPYTVADDPATAPQAVIHPGQRCTTPDGQELAQMMDLGVRTWGNAADGATVMLTGTYQLDGEVSRRLLRALPTLLVLRDDAWDSPLVALLADEIVKDDPGQEAVLDRLLDLLLIAVLRAWFARPEADAPAWYRAYGDPVVGRALRMLHHNPSHPWTVAALADDAGVSRAALARRFNDLVGEPPMSLPHRLAHRPRRRPAARARRHRRLGGRAGRLRQPVRPQHRLQARPRRQPARVPRRIPGRLTRAKTPPGRSSCRPGGAPGRSFAESARRTYARCCRPRAVPRREDAPGRPVRPSRGAIA